MNSLNSTLYFLSEKYLANRFVKEEFMRELSKQEKQKAKSDFKSELKSFVNTLSSHISTSEGDWTVKKVKVIIPPIKSQGIKTKLVPWIMALVPKVKGKWIEPFLGTGVVAFNSGHTEAILNDTNPHIINFYTSIQKGEITPAIVRKYLEEEGEKLRNAEEDGYAYYRYIRNRFNKDYDPLDFLFLSRAGFNGMMRFNKNGSWNIPFCQKPDRFSPAYITKIVNQVRYASEIIQDCWQFLNIEFDEVISMASENDIIYCDPPYIGRYVDYYNGWNEVPEERLFKALSKTKSRFILSTWHHNRFRENEMVKKYWNRFNMVTKDHFYHSGGKIENRNAIVEALVFNFETDIKTHNHGEIKKPEQLRLFEKKNVYTNK